MNELSRGSRGAIVRAWQSVLVLARLLTRASVDGAFGPITAEKTKQLQRRHGLTADGVVDAHTWAASPAPPRVDFGEGAGVWIHRLGRAIERARPLTLGAHLQQLGLRFALIKVLDGRERMNEEHLDDELLDDLRAHDVTPVFWQWVYCAYYPKKGPAKTTVAYVREQARLFGEICVRYGVNVAVANIEGDGYWSTSPWAPKGLRNRATWGNANVEHEVAERARTYAAELRAVITSGACAKPIIACSTHGLPKSQRLPWRQLIDCFDVVMPQIYGVKRHLTWPGVIAACFEQWGELGALGKLRITGGSWTAKQERAMRQLGALVQGLPTLVSPHLDWWTYELAEQAHLDNIKALATGET